MDEIESKLRKYISEKFMFSRDHSKLDPNASLIDNRVLDPTGVGVHALVNYIEKTFNLRVEDSELVPENFETLAALTAYVGRKLKR